MLDAYAVRKAIPRIVLAVIAINLSIYLCVAALDLIEVIGRGMNNLLVSPFIDGASYNGTKIENNAETGIVGVIGASGFLAGLIASIFFILTNPLAVLGFLLPLLGTVALIAVAILFTLVIRQGLLVFLIIISPVAIVCYVLPGTEKYFKQWFDLFLKTLMIYPIIAIIFAMSNVLAAILLTNASGSAASAFTNPATAFQSAFTFAQTETSDASGVVKLLVAIIVIYAPLALIPFSFKLAGGAIGQIANVANKQASGTAAGMRGRIAKSKEDPDSTLGKAKLQAKSQRVDRGFTMRQMAARRPGGANRAQRISAAREYDQKKVTAQSQEGFGFKSYQQDSDVMQSLVMNDQEVALHRATQTRTLEQARAAMAQTETDRANGTIGAQEYSDRMADQQGNVTAAERQLAAHSVADRIGRTGANRRAAFLNADRIKYNPTDGQIGYEENLARAEEIFGGGSSTAEAMNAFQAIAKGPAGRADLSGQLYGRAYDIDRATGAQSTYMLMNQGRPDSVAQLADQHIDRVNDVNATEEERQRSAAFLHTLKQAKGQGTEANNAVVNERMGNIDGALSGHIARRTQHHAANATTQPMAEMRNTTVTEPDTRPGAAPGATVTRERQERVVLTPQERTTRARQEAERAARKELADQSQAYSQPDPSEREQQQNGP